MSTTAVPSPRLEYRVDRGGRQIDHLADHAAPRGLADVSYVSAWLSRTDVVRMYVHGSMRKKDGGSGPSRGLEVDPLDADNPPWLADIVDDAQRRLA